MGTTAATTEKNNENRKKKVLIKNIVYNCYTLIKIVGFERCNKMLCDGKVLIKIEKRRKLQRKKIDLNLNFWQRLFGKDDSIFLLGFLT